MEKKTGLLMKSIGGFYYVRCGEIEYECKARGSFRKKGSSPLVGDRVVFTVPEGGGFCAIEEILPRKNKLKRPALCNIDALVIVCSTVDPLPNFTVIDKMTAAAMHVVCGMIVAVGLFFIWDRTWLRAVGSFALLGFVTTFHAIFNVFVNQTGAVFWIGSAFPLMLMLAYLLFLRRKVDLS